MPAAKKLAIPDMERVNTVELQKLLAFRDEMRGPAVLHISDTFTRAYDNVETLLRTLRPELVIHTGDMADEWKGGRIPEHLPPYREAVDRLIAVMKQYAGEVWIVHGNNDDAPWIRRHQGIVVMPMEGVEREYCGLRLYMQHTPVQELAEGRYDFALYGHGYTADRHDPADNKPGRLCYINGVRAATLIDCATKRYLQIPYREVEA